MLGGFTSLPPADARGFHQPPPSGEVAPADQLAVAAAGGAASVGPPGEVAGSASPARREASQGKLWRRQSLQKVKLCRPSRTTRWAVIPAATAAGVSRSAAARGPRSSVPTSNQAAWPS